MDPQTLSSLISASCLGLVSLYAWGDNLYLTFFVIVISALLRVGGCVGVLMGFITGFICSCKGGRSIYNSQVTAYFMNSFFSIIIFTIGGIFVERWLIGWWM